jgi:hypothetical protein
MGNLTSQVNPAGILCLGLGSSRPTPKEFNPLKTKEIASKLK